MPHFIRVYAVCKGKKEYNIFLKIITRHPKIYVQWTIPSLLYQNQKEESISIQGVLDMVYKKLFVAFPWVETSTGQGGFMICVFII